MELIKIAVVGDEAVGKTCMLISCTSDTFAASYVPTAFDDYALNVSLDGKYYSLAVSITAGSEEHSQLRTIMYSGADILLVCFSVVDPNSFDNVEEKWLPEIKNYCSGTPFLLVGTQVDLRDDPETINQLAVGNQNPVSTKDGQQLAKKLKAVGYVECSAKTQECLLDVLEMALRAALRSKKQKKQQNQQNKKCTTELGGMKILSCGKRKTENRMELFLRKTETGKRKKISSSGKRKTENGKPKTAENGIRKTAYGKRKTEFRPTLLQIKFSPERVRTCDLKNVRLVSHTLPAAPHAPPQLLPLMAVMKPPAAALAPKF